MSRALIRFNSNIRHDEKKISLKKVMKKGNKNNTFLFL